MVSPVMNKLRAEVLSLPDKDRAELAQELMASLDGTPEPDAAQAWDVEILRRLAEIDSGTARLIDRTEFSRRLRERISRP
jgi:putative addiction module component (TIGR02574 family)